MERQRRGDLGGLSLPPLIHFFDPEMVTSCKSSEPFDTDLVQSHEFGRMDVVLSYTDLEQGEREAAPPSVMHVEYII
jgi:hypothetical protein